MYEDTVLPLLADPQNTHSLDCIAVTVRTTCV